MSFKPAALVLAACLPLVAAAQEPVRPTLSAAKLDVVPALDGKVIGDPAWQAIVPETTFTPTTPNAGQAASQRTELRVAFSEDALYVAVVCHDDEPGLLVVSDARRDGALGDTDSVRLVFDTYRDEQNGFVFGTNAAGMEFDAQLS